MVTSNLPQQPTSFVGRQTEINELKALLDAPACRLLTLVGPGGIGKTRLAIAVAETQVSHFADGVWLASLQPVRSTNLAIPTIAESIQLPIQGMEDPYQQLINNLRDKAMLLVLDNYEQLLDHEGLRLVVDILEAAPATKLLLTSREALNLQEEWRYVVAGLSVPDADSRDEPDDYDAIQLLIERARRAHPQLSLAGEQDCIVQICTLVEGMPLAIEMAASWLSVLSCEDLATRIQHGLLDTRLQNVPARHQSMIAVFDQSWQLLDEHKRSIFSKLSVFAGGFRSDAATYVAGMTAEALASLVDKSLLTLETSGRYKMHELIRQFAEEKLNEVPDQRGDVLDRHCDYYAEFLHLRGGEFRTQQSDHAVSEIEEEIDNVRVAWACAIERHRSEQLRLMARCLAEYYDFRNWYQEGACALEQAVTVLRTSQPIGTQGLALGIALAGQGNLLHNLGEMKRAEECLREAISILRPLHAVGEIAHALGHLNRLLSAVGKFKEAAESSEECIALAEEAGDEVTLTYGLVNLIIINGVLGKYDKARQLQHEVLARFQAINHQLGVAMATSLLGDIEYVLGDYELAQQHLQESLDSLTHLGSRWHLSLVYRFLGQVAHAMGDYREAKQFLESSLTIAHEVGDPRVIAFSVITLGNLFCSLGEFRQAQQYYRQGLLMAQKGSHRWQESISLLGLGRAAYGLKDYELSSQYLQTSLALCREISWELGVAHTLSSLGRVATRKRDLSEARQCFHEALRCGTRIGVRPVLLDVLVAGAEMFAAEQDGARAVELLMLCLAHSASHADTKAAAEELLSGLRTELPHDILAVAQERDQVGDLETVIRQMFALFSPQASSLPASSQMLVVPLTPREYDVLALIIAGYTNQEIGSQLHISVNTVKKHVNHIFDKLDVKSRTQAVGKARQLNLLV